MRILPLAAEPFTPATDRDMLSSERREFVRTHRTCVFGTPRRADGPAAQSHQFALGIVIRHHAIQRSNFLERRVRSHSGSNRRSGYCRTWTRSRRSAPS